MSLLAAAAAGPGAHAALGVEAWTKATCHHVDGDLHEISTGYRAEASAEVTDFGSRIFAEGYGDYMPSQAQSGQWPDTFVQVAGGSLPGILVPTGSVVRSFSKATASSDDDPRGIEQESYSEAPCEREAIQP